jgi:hypothetical protein
LSGSATKHLTGGISLRDEEDNTQWHEEEDGDDDGDDDVSGSEDMQDRDDDGDDDVSGSEDMQDRDEWVGIVKWADVPFSAPGDSGSLVFAIEEGVTIPLGIHVGAPTSIPQHSVFISIETFCYEAENEGWELHFTER